MASLLGDSTPTIDFSIFHLPQATDTNLRHEENCAVGSGPTLRLCSSLLVAVTLFCFVAPLLASGPRESSTQYLFALPNASAPPPIAPTRPGTPIATLIAKALNHVISVVVGLKLERPWTPEGHLPSLEINQQRAAIATAVTRSVRWPRLRDVDRRYAQRCGGKTGPYSGAP